MSYKKVVYFTNGKMPRKKMLPNFQRPGFASKQFKLNYTDQYCRETSTKHSLGLPHNRRITQKKTPCANKARAGHVQLIQSDAFVQKN